MKETRNTDNAKKLPGFRERLQYLADEAGSLNALAKQCNIPQSSLRHYLDTGEPPAKVLVTLAQVTGVALDWIATGEGPMRRELPREESEDIVHIPLHDLRHGGRKTVLSEGAPPVDIVAFRKGWLHGYLHVEPADLKLYYVEGDVMEPTLREGDVIMIDTSDTSLIRGGIYLLNMGGALSLKRLHIGEHNSLEASSDNPHYPVRRIEKSALGSEVKVVGKVIWAGKRL